MATVRSASASDMGRSYSTPAFDYTFQRTVQRCERAQGLQPCKLVEADVIPYGIILQVPCFYCDRNLFNRNEYLEFYARKLATLLCSHFFDMPLHCAEQVSDTFRLIVDEANDDHTISCLNGVPITTVVHMCIDRIHRLEMVGENRALGDSLHGAAGPRFNPPSAADESGWSASAHDCVICMDPIRTRRTSLTMDCSHVFHKDCLLQWLNTSNVCPLCRYQMPTHH